MFDKKSLIFKSLIIAGGVVITATAVTTGIVIGVNVNENNQSNIVSNDLDKSEQLGVVFNNNFANKSILKASDVLKSAQANLANQQYFQLETSNQTSLIYTINFSEAISDDNLGKITFPITITRNGSTNSFTYKTDILGFLPNDFSEDVNLISNNFSLENPGQIKIEQSSTNTSITVKDLVLMTPTEAIKTLNNKNFDFSLNEPTSIKGILSFVNAKESSINSNNSIYLNFELKNLDKSYNFDLNAKVASVNDQNLQNQIVSQTNYLKSNFVNPISVDSIENSPSTSLLNLVNFSKSTSKLPSQLALANLKINDSTSQFNKPEFATQNLFNYSLVSIEPNNTNQQTTITVKISSEENKDIFKNFTITLNNFITLQTAVLNSQNLPILKDSNTLIKNIFTPGILISSSENEINAAAKSSFETLYNLPENSFGFDYTLNSVVPNFDEGSVNLQYTISGQGVTGNESGLTYNKKISGFLKKNQEDYQIFNTSNSEILKKATSDVSTYSEKINPINSAFLIKGISVNDTTGKRNINLNDVSISDITFDPLKILKDSPDISENSKAYELFLQTILKNNFSKSFISENFDFITNNIIPSMEVKNIKNLVINKITNSLSFDYDITFNTNLSNPSTSDISLINNSVSVDGFEIEQSPDEQNINMISNFLGNEENFVFGTLNKNKIPTNYNIQDFEPINLASSASDKLIPGGSNPIISISNINANNDAALVTLTVSIKVGTFTKTGNIIVSGFVNPNQSTLDEISTKVNFTANKNLLPSQIKTLIEQENNSISASSSANLKSIISGFSFSTSNLSLQEYNINIIPGSVSIEDSSGKLSFDYTITLLNFGNIISVQKSTGDIPGFLTTQQNNLNNAKVNFKATPTDTASLDFTPSEITVDNLKDIIENIVVGSETISDNSLYQFSNFSATPSSINGSLNITSVDITFNGITATLVNLQVANLKSQAQVTLEELFAGEKAPTPSVIKGISDYSNLTINDFEVQVVAQGYKPKIISVTPNGTPTQNKANYSVVVRIESQNDPNVFIQYTKNVDLPK